MLRFDWSVLHESKTTAVELSGFSQPFLAVLSPSRSIRSILSAVPSLQQCKLLRLFQRRWSVPFDSAIRSRKFRRECIIRFRTSVVPSLNHS